VAAVYEYSPCGELLRNENPDSTLAAAPQAFRFSTKFTDDETGLVYYGRRYYHPWKGRFLGRDPKEEAGGLNLYGFVTNNQINRWDVLGMFDGFLACGWGQAYHDWATAPMGPSTWVMSGSGTTTASVSIGTPISPSTGQAVPSFGPTSALGSALSNVPLIGGILGGIGDTISGVTFSAAGLVTFGGSGTLGTGLSQIGNGLGSVTTIIAADVAATAVGVVGTVFTTSVALFDVATFGTLTMTAVGQTQPNGLVGAVSNLGANILIPEYGAFGGLNWGTSQGRGPDAVINNVDAASRIHDLNLGVVPGANTTWVITNYSPVPNTQIAPGPVGIAYVLVGTIPFLVADPFTDPKPPTPEPTPPTT
jgi:RHS repeat-associated protein